MDLCGHDAFVGSLNNLLSNSADCRIFSAEKPGKASSGFGCQKTMMFALIVAFLGV